uniref:Retinal G protein coupled receptor n=1 Tax=Mus musculus TaxID=10090 RepID=A0A286YCJ0_MOUSE
MAATRALPAGLGELEVLAVGTVLLMEALSGISLNGLTIFSFCKTPDLRTPSNLLVLSLALADTGISLNALVAAVSSLLRQTVGMGHGHPSGAVCVDVICLLGIPAPDGLGPL